ncbi:hypothetical protein IW150_002298 [Coemansia sp. RSA 2607]|nr:hypothetical protein IW150_002298 [Coemansia sp. RSA 2607]KAJ2386168.1 hypothetical protein GGI05_004468 [Coemansia sp. RSA 2603]
MVEPSVTESIPQSSQPEVSLEEPYNEQYLLFAHEVGAPQEAGTLADFLVELGLSNKYIAYMKATRGMFASIAQQAPTYSKCEPSMMEWFNSAVSAMQKFDYTDYPLAAPTAAYQYVQYRSTVTNTYLASDATLCYPGNTKDENAHMLVSSSSMEKYVRTMTLGRLVHRVLRVWKHQPMRAFVPAVFVYNADLVLLVFAQQRLRRFCVGRFFRERRVKKGCKMAVVEKTLRLLWFMLVLPPARFGHAGGVLNVARPFRFGGTKSQATVELADVSDKDLVAIKICLQSPRSMLAPKRYVFAAMYKGHSALLKLAWRSEHGVHGSSKHTVLVDCGTPGVPRVYASGVLCSALFGQRLEYVLVEDCGVNSGKTCLQI